MASAASISISRLLPFSSSTKTAAAAAALFPTKSLHSSKLSISSSSSSSSSFIRPLKVNPIRINSSSSYSSAAPISASLSVGSKLPDATLSYIDSDGEVQTTTVSDLTKSKKAILFAVPGAFTPTCSQKHVPGFVEKSGELKAKGVDVIACISVNDVFVMKAWKENLKVGDEVLLLSDGNLEFTKAIEAELDLSDKPVGLGVRSRRYSMLVDDGVVKVLNMEEGGAFTSSGADDILKVL